MAKANLTALFNNISGTIGELTFAQQKHGVVRVRKKSNPRNANSNLETEVRKTFAELATNWSEMLLKQRLLWEMYAAHLNAGKKRIGTLFGRKGRTDTDIRGQTAYYAVNQMLINSGLKKIDKPPHNQEKIPLPPITDIRQYGTYKDEIKFKIWLPFKYKPKLSEKEVITVAQIAIYTNIQACMHHILRPLPILTTDHTEIKINKIKIRKKMNNTIKAVEVPINKIKHGIIQIQMRTVAQNGTVSLPSSKYIIELM